MPFAKGTIMRLNFVTIPAVAIAYSRDRVVEQKDVCVLSQAGLQDIGFHLLILMDLSFSLLRLATIFLARTARGGILLVVGGIAFC